ncbi:MAG: helix-turn-helix domain-containing protein [Pseudonocardiaceae bacterium]
MELAIATGPPARILLAGSWGLVSGRMIDPTVLAAPAMRAALAARDISQVYRLLNAAGVSQRTIAALVGQSQSEVLEIVHGRQVQAYAVLHRICTGLGVPGEAMGLCTGAYPGGSAVAELSEEDEAEVLRRQFDHLFAVTGVAVLCTAAPGLGRFLSPTALPAGQPLAVPARIGRADVQAIRELTAAVAETARTVGGQAGPACLLAEWADGFLAAEASDAARRDLLAALAQLHVIAAWCCHDSYAPIPAHQHFAQAVELATEVGDTYRVSYALSHAAGMLIDRGQPNRALKLVSMAEYNLADAPREDPRIAPLRSGLVVISALAQAQLAAPVSGVQARRVRSALARSRDGYEPPSLHHSADMDLYASWVHLHLGSLDTAESLAAVAGRTFAEGKHGREGVLAGITVARVHLLAGEPDAGQRAAQAIEAVRPLRSGAARTRLAPLAQDLHTRPDLADLARQARKIATTRV